MMRRITGIRDHPDTSHPSNGHAGYCSTGTGDTNESAHHTPGMLVSCCPSVDLSEKPVTIPTAEALHDEALAVVDFQGPWDDGHIADVVYRSVAVLCHARESTPVDAAQTSNSLDSSRQSQ